jgi:hypothetical protein
MSLGHENNEGIASQKVLESDECLGMAPTGCISSARDGGTGSAFCTTSSAGNARNLEGIAHRREIRGRGLRERGGKEEDSEWSQGFSSYQQAMWSGQSAPPRIGRPVLLWPAPHKRPLLPSHRDPVRAPALHHRAAYLCSTQIH